MSVAEPNEEIFQKCAMQKQKNAIFIHIWWVAPDINSHMSQRHPPAIIRPISQKALLKKWLPREFWFAKFFIFFSLLEIARARSFSLNFVFFFYLTCYLLLPIFRYRI